MFRYNIMSSTSLAIICISRMSNISKNNSIRMMMIYNTFQRVDETKSMILMHSIIDSILNLKAICDELRYIYLYNTYTYQFFSFLDLDFSYLQRMVLYKGYYFVGYSFHAHYVSIIKRPINQHLSQRHVVDKNKYLTIRMKELEFQLEFACAFMQHINDEIITIV